MNIMLFEHSVSDYYFLPENFAVVSFQCDTITRTAPAPTCAII